MAEQGGAFGRLSEAFSNAHGYLFARHPCPQPSFKKTWRFHPGSVHFKSADSIEYQNGAEPLPPAEAREARNGHSKTAYAGIMDTPPPLPPTDKDRNLSAVIARWVRSAVFLLTCLAGMGRVMAQSRVELGPWIGAVTETSAVVKAKLRKPDYAAYLIVSNESSASVHRIGPVFSTTNHHRVVEFVLGDLQPNTRYRCTVEIKGTPENAMAATFQTFPAGPASFRFAFASCGRTGSTNASYERIRGNDPLFFICPGDFHYEDIATNRLDKFWHAYDRVFGSPVQARLYRQVPLVYVWDDHDFCGNGSDDRAVARGTARRAYELYAPHYPLVFPGMEAPIAQAFTVGRVRFLVTDLRSQREPTSRTEGPGKTMLGEPQKQWLKRELIDANGKCPLIFWVSSVPWNGTTQTNHYWPVTTNQFGFIHHSQLEYTPHNGVKASKPAGGDSWAWYATERQEIARFIRDQHIHGLVILHGDMHALAADDGSHTDFAPGGGAPIPVFAAAPLDRDASIKGGLYSAGVYKPKKGEGCFGLVDVQDLGNEIVARYSGRSNDDIERIHLEVRFPANP